MHYKPNGFRKLREKLDTLLKQAKVDIKAGQRRKYEGKGVKQLFRNIKQILDEKNEQGRSGDVKHNEMGTEDDDDVDDVVSSEDEEKETPDVAISTRQPPVVYQHGIHKRKAMAMTTDTDATSGEGTQATTTELHRMVALLSQEIKAKGEEETVLHRMEYDVAAQRLNASSFLSRCNITAEESCYADTLTVIKSLGVTTVLLEFCAPDMHFSVTYFKDCMRENGMPGLALSRVWAMLERWKNAILKEDDATPKVYAAAELGETLAISLTTSL
jgi:hypothetical protein